MQTYDMLMALVLVAATLFGFWKGMAWQVASLASLIVSYFAALRFADQLAPMISDSAPWNKFVAMLAIYIGASFVIWTIFRLVSGAIDRVKLDGFDHQMGALIGLGKGILLCIAITFFAVAILPQAQKDMIIASRAGEYIVRILDKTDAIVPPEIHDVIHPYVERIEQQLNPNYQPSEEQGFQAQWPDLPVQWPTQQNAPNQNAANNGWPQQPQQQQQQPAAPAQPAWPTTAPQPPQNNPFPPQTAERQGGVPY
ncbi:MAG: CvpA family protein [Planctomycetes bacterium]|nr:CvpA family protein [Planctomycetota bacterium]